jgi:predicted amidophosphoribosyltransferase
MSRRPPHRKPTPPKRSPYAGPTTCLRCDAAFESWDRRQNRLCARCQQAIKEDSSGEPSYTLPKSRRRSQEPDDR